MNPRVITTILIDLDGTLLDVDMSVLLDSYFPLLARRFNAAKDVDAFREHLLAAVREMMANRDGGRGLAGLFLEYLAPRLGVEPEMIREKFRAFHCGEFHDLRSLTRPAPGAAALVSRAAEFGYTIALATNPVFFAEAIAARLGWAGLGVAPFHFISSAENMHFCKPHPEYFMEVLGNLHKSPFEAVMVGNDPAKDMPAAAVGITTFHVTSETGPGAGEGADMTGRLEDALRWIEASGPVI